MALLRRHIAELFSTHDEFVDIRSENCYILGSRSRIALSPSLANEGNCILQYKCWLVLCRHRSGTRTTFSHHISICFISYGKTVISFRNSQFSAHYGTMVVLPCVSRVVRGTNQRRVRYYKRFGATKHIVLENILRW